MEQLAYEIDYRQARNSNTPSSDLLRLATTGCYAVRLEAIRNPALPDSGRAELVARVVTEISSWFGKGQPAKSITSMTSADVVAAFHALNIGKDPNDPRLFTALSRSRDWLRRAAAVFFVTPSSRILHRLMRDKNSTVRFLAEQRIAKTTL
jgi:hypothetical protein